MTVSPTSLDIVYAVRDCRDPRVRGPHRSTLVGLVMYRKADGKSDPSAKQLADAVGCGRSTVIRCLSELSVWSYLRATFRGWHRSSVYEVVWPFPVTETYPAETSRPETSRSETPLSETSPRKTPRSDNALVSQRALPGIGAIPTRSPSDTLLGISLGNSTEDLSGEGARARAKPARKTERGSRLAEDWRPSPEQIEKLSKKHGADPMQCFENFQTFWLTKAGAGGVKCRWPLVFDRWVAKEAEDGKLESLADQPPAYQMPYHAPAPANPLARPKGHPAHRREEAPLHGVDVDDDEPITPERQAEDRAFIARMAGKLADDVGQGMAPVRIAIAAPPAGCSDASAPTTEEQRAARRVEINELFDGCQDKFGGFGADVEDAPWDGGAG